MGGDRRRRRRFSIGGNHTIHMLRRNVGLKVLLFKQSYLWTYKGPVFADIGSEIRRRSPTPLRFSRSAVQSRVLWPIGGGSGPSSRAPRWTVFQSHLKRHAEARGRWHKGSAFVEILQNCNIFNDGRVVLNHGNAMRRSEHVLATRAWQTAGVRQESRQGHSFANPMATSKSLHSENGITESDLIVHDRAIIRGRRTLLYCRTWSIVPASPDTYQACFAPGTICRATKDVMNQQINDVIAKRGAGDLKQNPARGRHLGSTAKGAENRRPFPH